MPTPALTLALGLQPLFPAAYLLVAAAAVFVASLLPAALARVIVRTYFRIEAPFAEAVQAAVMLLAVMLAAVLVMHKMLGVSAVWMALHAGTVVGALALLAGPAVFGAAIRSPDGATLGLRRGAAVTFLVTMICAGFVALIVIVRRVF